MRTIKKLLIILTENEYYFECGLCILAIRLYYAHMINRDEREFLETYIVQKCIEQGRPEYYFGTSPEEFQAPYYFPIGEWAPRLEWLQNEIKNLS